MPCFRRLSALVILTAALCAPLASQAQTALYGQVGKMTVKPGQREALIGILLGGTRSMPGCISYVVAKDAKDADVLWITELWTDKASHDASLSLPAVQDAIRQGRSLIAAIDGAATMPVGGIGLTSVPLRP